MPCSTEKVIYFGVLIASQSGAMATFAPIFDAVGRKMRPHGPGHAPGARTQKRPPARAGGLDGFGRTGEDYQISRTFTPRAFITFLQSRMEYSP